MKVGLNLKSRFLSTKWVEAVSKAGNNYVALDLEFDVDGKTLRHRIFPPRAEGDRRYVNELLRNLCEALGADYDSVPAAEKDAADPFKEFALNLSQHLGKYQGDEIYLKTVREGKFARLGLSIPVFSENPDLSYSADEQDKVDTREGVKVNDIPY